MKKFLILVAAYFLLYNSSFAQDSLQDFLKDQPVIDMHFHITKGYEENESYRDLHPDIDRAKLEWMVHNFTENNVVLAVGGGNQKYAELYAEAADRFWAGLIFPCNQLVEQDKPCENEFYSEEELREIYGKGNLKILGESMFNYYGIPPTDERLAPYWKIAAEFDLPVGIHAELGPPMERVNKEEYPNYNPAYANPELLKPILEQYPDLKIYLMHYGGEYSDEAIELMKDYPQIYTEISAVSLFMPKAVWEPNLRKLFEADLGNRLMFGSDYFGTVGQHMQVIMDIDWLTDQQKRDIFYNNAARFLGLTKAEIEHHYQMVKK